MLWGKEFPQRLIFGEEGFFTEPRYLPRQYPYYVARAFLSVQYDDEPREDEEVYYWYRVAWEATEAFVERWGGVDEETLRRVLREGEGRDRLAAVFALGHSPFEGVNEELAALLEEPDWLLRCAAACCLVLRRDERATPLIERYLALPTPIGVDGGGRVSTAPQASGWYNLYKQLVPWMLAEWGPSSLLPALRDALLESCREGNDKRLSPAAAGSLKASAYALGRRGALGALHGVKLPVLRRWLSVLYMALGYLKAAERFSREALYEQLQGDTPLSKEVLALLTEAFALPEQQAQSVLMSWQIERIDGLGVLL
uniref:Uncharacterized protein n=1 Tax=Thermogemmatispora argillosa TaxID=2045280 RepID=A0A455SV49_9CHLR|nr:hypothetical protein KTA_05020 [Thermogemmatispora argillosa]